MNDQYETQSSVNRVDEIMAAQRAYFRTGATLPVRFRVEKLKQLREVIRRREDDVTAALRADLGKSAFEGYMCEVGMTLSEVTYMIKHTKRFAARRRVRTPLAQFASTSFRKASPYGNVLVMSPWNYPFLLSMEPLVDAIAAGNTVVLKPSAYSPATGKIISEITEECFAPEHVAVILGGRAENACLLEKKFDFIFFTGSQNVGREVLRHTAETLTPAILELGGKSPCIVDRTAKIKLAARRIVFGKYLNCGQTCVAPDYVLCDRAVKDDLIREIKHQIVVQYGEHPLENPEYGKMVNVKHFERIRGLIDPVKVVHGGDIKDITLQIEPTVMDDVTWDDAVMQEEIFGPLMPVLTFERREDIFPILADKQKPLAMYLFSEDQRFVREAIERLSYGGGCINDTIIHLATSEMGFGGVGESGMGEYHGKAGFDAFSHTKSMVNKKTWMDLPMRYHPYKKGNNKLLHIFLR